MDANPADGTEIVIVRLAVQWLALFHVSDGILGQQIVNHSHRLCCQLRRDHQSRGANWWTSVRIATLNPFLYDHNFAQRETLPLAGRSIGSLQGAS
jgi:hypothetical protein